MESKLYLLRDLAVKKGFLAKVSFKGLRYALLLEKVIRIEDKATGMQVRWYQAFGNMKLPELLRNFQLEFILLERGRNEVHLFNNIDEAISFLQKS